MEIATWTPKKMQGVKNLKKIHQNLRDHQL